MSRLRIFSEDDSTAPRVDISDHVGITRELARIGPNHCMF